MRLIIQHVSNTLDSTLRITGQVRPAKCKQDIWQIDDHPALGLTRLKIASFELFKQLTVAFYFLALSINLLLVRCEFRIALLKLIPNDCAGDPPQRAANGGPRPRIPHRRTNNRAGGGSKTSAPQGAFLSG